MNATDGQVGLAGAGWAEEDHVLPAGDAVQGAQVRDGLALEAAAWLKSDSSRLLWAGMRTTRLRPSPPWDSESLEGVQPGEAALDDPALVQVGAVGDAAAGDPGE